MTKEEIKLKLIIFKFGYITKEDIKEHYPNWTEISDHPYKILIIGRSGSRKTNALPNLINNEPNIDKVYLYPKTPSKAKYQLPIKKKKKNRCKLFY